MSGVKLDDACKVKYDEVQKKHMHRFVTFHIKDDKEIVVDKVKPFFYKSLVVCSKVVMKK